MERRAQMGCSPKPYLCLRHHLSSPKLQTCLVFNLILFLNLQLFYLPEIKSFHIKLQCCSITYCQTFHNFCNHQTVIGIIVSHPERSYKEYTRMASHVYQYVINLVVSLPIRRGPGVLINVSVWEHRGLNK